MVDQKMVVVVEEAAEGSTDALDGVDLSGVENGLLIHSEGSSARASGLSDNLSGGTGNNVIRGTEKDIVEESRIDGAGLVNRRVEICVEFAERHVPGFRRRYLFGFEQYVRRYSRKSLRKRGGIQRRRLGI